MVSEKDLLIVKSVHAKKYNSGNFWITAVLLFISSICLLTDIYFYLKVNCFFDNGDKAGKILLLFLVIGETCVLVAHILNLGVIIAVLRGNTFSKSTYSSYAILCQLFLLTPMMISSVS